MYIFARFHVRAGEEKAAEAALGEVMAPSRAEPGCVEIHAYRSKRDARLFYIHSEWKDEAAFEAHAELAHTRRFIERMGGIADQAVEVTRSERIG